MASKIDLRNVCGSTDIKPMCSLSTVNWQSCRGRRGLCGKYMELGICPKCLCSFFIWEMRLNNTALPVMGCVCVALSACSLVFLLPSGTVLDSFEHR